MPHCLTEEIVVEIFVMVIRERGVSQSSAAVRESLVDPNVWSGRALQEGSLIWRRAVLHQCIRPLVGACCAPGHHGYQRACNLISGQASIGPFGSPVFARTGKTDPPSHFILSQTSAGNRLWDYVIAGSLSVSSFVRAIRPFLRPGVCLCWGAARKGRQGWPSRLACGLLPRFQATP